MLNNDGVQLLSDKLDVIITLLAHQIGPELSVAERAPVLNGLGLDRNQIAKVCGSDPKTVSTRLAEASKKGKKKAEKK